MRAGRSNSPAGPGPETPDAGWVVDAGMPSSGAGPMPNEIGGKRVARSPLRAAVQEKYRAATRPAFPVTRCVAVSSGCPRGGLPIIWWV